MNENQGIRVIVAGAGIGGFATALALRRFGYAVDIYEAASGPRNSGAAFGIGSNAIRVLNEIGIDLAGAAAGMEMRRFELLNSRGGLIRRVPMPEMARELGGALVTITRRDLLVIFNEALDGCTVNYNSRIVGYERFANGVEVIFEDGHAERADVLVGADGIHSSVRENVVGHEESPMYHGYVCWLATTPFSHEKLTPGFAGHYWGNGKRFGLVDLGDGITYWWATKNVDGDYWKGSKRAKEEVLAAFGNWAPEVGSAIEATHDNDIVMVPAWDRPFCGTWGDGPVTLVGDAAHPMLPSLAQGGGSAIEDGFVLARALSSFAGVDVALRKYEDFRRDRTENLVNTARRISRIEQVENPLACALRNATLRFLPESVVRAQNMAPMRFEFPTWSGGSQRP